MTLLASFSSCFICILNTYVMTSSKAYCAAYDIVCVVYYYVYECVLCIIIILYYQVHMYHVYLCEVGWMPLLPFNAKASALAS